MSLEGKVATTQKLRGSIVEIDRIPNPKTFAHTPYIRKISGGTIKAVKK